MAYTVKRRGKWCVRFKGSDGREVQVPTDATTKKAAKSLGEHLEREAAALREASTEETRAWTLEKLIEWWMEQLGPSVAAKKDRSAARLVLDNPVADMALAELRPAHLEDFLHELKATKSPATRRKTRALIGRAFRMARKRGKWAGADVVKDVEPVKVPKTTVGDFLKPEEVPAVLEALEPEWRSLFACAVYSGARKGELAALQRSDVDLVRGILTIRTSWDSATTKGGHADPVPIHPELVPHLRRALAESTHRTKVFPDVDRNTDLPIVLRRALRNAGLVDYFEHRCMKWGCEYSEKASDKKGRFCALHPTTLLRPLARARPIRWHDLRHTAATLLLQAGCSIATVQKMLRHRDPKLTTETYGHFAVDYLGREISKMRLFPGAKPDEIPDGGGSAGVLKLDTFQKAQRLQELPECAILDSNQWPSAPESVAPCVRNVPPLSTC